MFEWLFGNADRTRDTKVSKQDIEEALDLIAQYLGKRSGISSGETGSADLYCEDWTSAYSDSKIKIESEHTNITWYDLIGEGWNDYVYRDKSRPEYVYSKDSPYRTRAWLAKDYTLVFDTRPYREWDSSVGRWIEGTSFREGAWITYVMEELLPKAKKRQEEVMAWFRKRQNAAERAYADAVRHRNRPVDDSDVFR